MPTNQRPAQTVESILTSSKEERMYTVKEFCELVRISRRYFDLIKSQGRAPMIERIGGRLYISETSAAEWLKRQERREAA